MVFSTPDAVDILGLDSDSYLIDSLVVPLVESLPSQIEKTTGLTIEEQEKEPLVFTLSSFLIQLWFNAEDTQSYRLQRVIDSLTSTIKHNRDTQ
ncbi:hypothetical protein [Ruoffia sp. FAM 26255]|uniref:hypothetical protein n=1 Tax=Ruoffia sp. FAM 26255 TaxID=3259519 RepID=UPI003884A7E2